jgi:hypothetical protein
MSKLAVLFVEDTATRRLHQLQRHAAFVTGDYYSAASP